MFTRKLSALLLAVSLALATAGCGGSPQTMPASLPMAASYQTTVSYAGETAAEVADDGGSVNQVVMAPENMKTAQASGPVPAPVSRKLIYTYRIYLETKTFDELSSFISQKATATGGYIEQSEVDGHVDAGNRSAHYTLRIPQDQAAQLLTELGELGNITSREESVDDVTLDYVDIESRKKSLEVEQERLFELLEKADNLESIIALEQRLSEVRGDLERFASRLRVLDNQVDYSTIHLSVSEVERITPVAEKSTWNRMGTGFSRSLYDIGQGLKNLAIFVVANLPYLILLGIVAVAILIVVRVALHSTKNKQKKDPPPPPAKP